MAPTDPPISTRRGGPSVPLPGQVTSMVLSLAATTVLTLFLTQRILAIRAWSRLPLVVWLVFAIYTDSYLFVFATAMLQHSFGVNSNLGTCDSAILLCLACYVTTKFIYLFLVEKAHIIRGTPKRRVRSKLYLFNSFGMLGMYIVVVLLNFIFRTAKMNNGACIIGMRSLALIPLISFDTVVNVYLTILFLIPLRKLYSFRDMPRNPANIRLRTIAFRTFCGAVCTLLSSIANLSVLMALNGEPGSDKQLGSRQLIVLFSAVVIQWVTSKDNAGTSSTTSSRGAIVRRDAMGPGSIRGATPCDFHSTPPPSTAADISLVSTARSSPYRDYATDGPGTDPRHPSSVVVTTTIRHESQRGGQVFSLADLGAGASGPGPGAGLASSRAGCGFLEPKGSSSPQTSITGGPHQDVKYDSQHSPC
ncbi:hypothetical protein TOPH_01014 [Tolypocladium ophioglossoides CBS 100239]|uniref:Uncharacterized protein n=1 Tax=Tolypocladium ophioglossoides (strain CBS 100239) TaxID=1163406 RepID=A0A0L0NJT1_TOLOC|nr:hypothetical protein TOPH_01014 [Tolypocladium ophioglossoides CBS 100239]